MSRRALAVLAAVLLLGAAPPPTPGTLSLDTSAPSYHQPVAFSWTLARAVRQGTLGLFCNQPPTGWAYIAEYPVSGVSGSASWILDNSTSSAVPGHLDYTLPADCQAYIYDERLVRQGKPAVITNQVFFTVPAEAP